MIVTSVNNEYIKGLCKLKDKKYRDSTNLFLIEGEHLVNEAINEELVKELVILEGCSFEYADKYADNITYVNENVMKKLSSMDSYPNIIEVATAAFKLSTLSFIFIYTFLSQSLP